METRFLIRRGKRALNRTARAHLARYNPRGEVVGAWCGRQNFDMNSNMPWGLKVCKQCKARWSR